MKRSHRKCPYCEYTARDDNVLKHLKNLHMEIALDVKLSTWKLLKPESVGTNKNASQCKTCGGMFKHLLKHTTKCIGVDNSKTHSKYISKSVQTEAVSIFQYLEKSNCSTQWLLNEQNMTSSSSSSDEASSSFILETSSYSSTSTSSFAATADLSINSAAADIVGEIPILRRKHTSSNNLFNEQLEALENYDFDVEGENRKSDSERDKRNFSKFVMCLKSLRSKLVSSLKQSNVDMRDFVLRVNLVKKLQLDRQQYKVNTLSTYVSHLTHCLRFVKSALSNEYFDKFDYLFAPVKLQEVDAAIDRYKGMKKSFKKDVRKYTARQRHEINDKILTLREISILKEKLHTNLNEAANNFQVIRDSLLLLAMMEMPLRIIPFLYLSVQHLKLAEYFGDSVFITTTGVEHKSEAMGEPDLVLSVKLLGHIENFVKNFNIQDRLFVSKISRKPYKSESALSRIVSKSIHEIIGRRKIGPCILRKTAVTHVRTNRNDKAKELAELLQHSETVQSNNYLAALTKERKAEMGSIMRSCLGL